MKKVEVEFAVNGKKRSLSVKPNDLLINIIRNDLYLTGSKYGCGIGECSACTVLLNGEPVLSCLTLAAAVDGKEITTIEGLAKGNELHPMQIAFLKNAAVQCGFCTPGMILTATALLKENPNPTEDEIRDYIRGNICRCTGYIQIVKAIKECAHGEKTN
ncbi:(2Fe-2S)-binding protein [bacterium]|nr:(2Fe-2S)-binding protein [bacterium]MBU4349915.1 (2Fe-2S)-binding protein [bacterium]MBU4510950.1 (2Fe-2S)-binding protein [bacterium]MCG2761559.1 (2Fe-2S)-binding protein [Candidatus Atribacteria bacterium]